MLVTVGDLVDDVVVRLGGPIRPATDTDSVIVRRRGGSAANVASTAARLGADARFVGQVGDDAVGRNLVGELAADGVDTSAIRYAGTTGTIVVLVDGEGERTMLTDRRTCRDLDRPDERWIDGADVLHLPLYSLVDGALAETAFAVADWAHDRGVAVSLDLSSVALLDELGPATLASIVGRVAPAMVFANADEAPSLGPIRSTLAADALRRSVVVVKRGGAAATVTAPGSPPIDVEPDERRTGIDTTGAGDAFAAGFVTARAVDGAPLWSVDPVAATRAAHRAAASLLGAR